jgi:signal transduction histidine kinase/DNA-binding response OmpR family regulator
MSTNFTLWAGIRTLLVLLSAGIILTGCQKKSTKATYTIGFSQCVGDDLWRKSMLDEMKLELSLHPGAQFVYADAKNNSEKQIEQVRTMVQQGIDLLIISPNEQQPLTAVVEEVYNKGIPVVVLDRKTSSSLYTAYVGADNYLIGKMAGQYIGSGMTGNVSVLEVMGLPGSSPAIERERGFKDAIKKYSNVTLTSKIYGDWLKTNTEQQLRHIKKDILKDINVIFAHNDEMALGARDVFTAGFRGRSIKIIGVDAAPGSGGGLEMVAKKKLDASVLYPTGGKEAIVTAFHILNKEPFFRDNTLESLVIDSSNVQMMNMQWSKINNQRKDIEKQQSLLEEQQNIYRSQQVVLNVIIILLTLSVGFGGLAFYSLTENRKINKRLEAKNNEILQQKNQLIEMSIRAEAAIEAKLNFFTNISHEFRTPLTLILSPLQEMMTNEKLVSMANKNMQMINKNCYRLLRLVNQLIDYRKIEYEGQTLKASEHNLVAFVSDIIDSFQLYIQKSGLKLHFSTSHPEINCWFDENMLDKVFFNLISNAIKFSTEQGKITIRIEKTDMDGVRVTIQDTGIGMKEEETKQVFDQFYQADHILSNSSGIGLSLSKEIVELHYGTINVTSQKWKGTTFILDLPLKDSHLQLHEKNPGQGTWGDLHEKSKVYSSDLDKAVFIKPEPFIHPREFSVLLVEDNPDLLAYLEEKLSGHFDVYTANNGNAALELAYQHVPELIISDILIPGISGKILAEKLKSDLRTSHIPIILLTAQGSIEQQISGVESMADTYITKPFHFDYLLASINNLIGNRQKLKEHFTSDISHGTKLPVAKNIDKKFISDFAAIVERNLGNEKLTVDDISQMIGISRIQLYRKVKALLGTNVSDYIMNRRLKKAKYLLKNENVTIAEITYMVGFANANYFSTVFKAKYNCTPSEFKRMEASELKVNNKEMNEYSSKDSI